MFSPEAGDFALLSRVPCGVLRFRAHAGVTPAALRKPGSGRRHPACRRRADVEPGGCGLECASSLLPRLRRGPARRLRVVCLRRRAARPSAFPRVSSRELRPEPGLPPPRTRGPAASSWASSAAPGRLPAIRADTRHVDPRPARSPQWPVLVRGVAPPRAPGSPRSQHTHRGRGGVGFGWEWRFFPPPVYVY